MKRTIGKSIRPLDQDEDLWANPFGHQMSAPFRPGAPGPNIFAEPTGGEVRVNTTTANAQINPAIAALADGGYVIGWLSNNQDGDGAGTFGQRFDANGAPAGDEFQINTTTAGDQFQPDLAGLAGGGFVAVWEVVQGAAEDVYARVYGADGDPLTGEILVNEFSAGRQYDTRVGATADGGFVVIWTSDNQDGSVGSVVAQRFDASGDKIGDEFIVNQTTFDNQVFPDIDALGDGFLAVWVSLNQDGEEYGIYARRYGAGGVALGDEFQVNTATIPDIPDVKSAALEDGGFVVIWQYSFPLGATVNFGLRAQRFDAGGDPVGGEFEIAAASDDSLRFSSVEGLDDGGFLVTWTVENAGADAFDVMSQQFDASGDPVGDPFLVNETTGNNQLFIFPFRPAAQLADGSIAYTWQGIGEGSVDDDIFTRIFTPEAVEPPPNNAPEAGDDSATTAEDTAVVIQVIANDSDPDGDDFTVVSVFAPSNGTVDVTQVNGDGTITYTPDAGFSGTDSFTYTIEDEAGAQDTATVTVTVADGSGGGGGPTPVGDEEQVNETTGTVENNATIAALEGGGIVVWTDNALDTGDQDIRARFIGADGAVGEEFVVNATTAGDQDHATVTALPGGGFVIIWDSNAPGGDGGELTGRVYSADGVPGEEFAVTTTSANSQTTPNVITLADGNFVVSWASSGQDGGGFGVYGRIFEADGTPVTGELPLGTGPSFQTNPALTATADGGFVAVWQNTPEGVLTGIQGQRFDADGNPVGDRLAIPGTQFDETDPSVAALDNGGFVIAYERFNGTLGAFENGIYFQMYDAAGAQVGTETEVFFTTSGLEDAWVTRVDDGFMLAWSAPGEGRDVLGRQYDLSGQPVGEAFVVSSSAAGDQRTGEAGASVTALADGSVAFVWNGVGTGADTNGIHVRRFTLDGAAPTNDDPVARNDNATTDEDQAVTIAVLANDTDADGDTLTVTAATAPANGTVAVNGDGTISYTPDADFSGTDNFEYTISDGEGGSDTASVTVTVNEVVDPPGNADPVARNDAATTDEDQTVTIAILANDTDGDGDVLTVTAATAPSNGTVMVNADGTITYTPEADFSGADSFGYTISDGNGGTDSANVTVTVNEVVDPPGNIDPVARQDEATTSENDAVVIAVLVNDSDADGDVLTITDVTAPDNGTAVVNADGTISYTPDADFVGEDVFRYTVSDGNGGTDTGRVTVTVTDDVDPPMNTPPVASDDAASTESDNAIVIAVLANDSDADGDALTVAAVTEAANGTVTINPDGTITYAPDDDFFGADSFGYTIADGNGGAASAIVTVNVEEVEEPDEGVTINAGPEDDSLTGTGFDDRLIGSRGDDTLVGLGGNDRLDGGDGFDVMTGGEGDDTLAAGINADSLDGGAGDDRLRGEEGRDTIVGGDGNDRLEGGDDKDELMGGAGEDTLIGGADRDTMTGGADTDRFRFDALDDFSGDAQFADRIMDFSQAQGDQIDLRKLDAITGGDDDAFAFIGNAAFSGTAGELRYEAESSTITYVEGDIDGDGAADFTIRLESGVALMAVDFLL